jgi:Mn2+/Fe2+ NRAMP family transporter
VHPDRRSHPHALVILGFFAATFGAALETGLSTGYTIS